MGNEVTTTMGVCPLILDKAITTILRDVTVDDTSDEVKHPKITHSLV